MNILEKYFLENNIITNKQAEAIGIKRHTLASLAKKGEIEVISLNNKQVVFSFHTALYLLGFNDRIPNIFHISVPQGYNVKHIKKSLFFFCQFNFKSFISYSICHRYFLI